MGYPKLTFCVNIIFIFFTEMETTSFHLRVEFSNYEKAYLTEHLQSYLGKVKRYDPSANVKTPNMTSHHNLLQFESTQETLIPAFQLFQLK